VGQELDSARRLTEGHGIVNFFIINSLLNQFLNLQICFSIKPFASKRGVARAARACGMARGGRAGRGGLGFRLRGTRLGGSARRRRAGEEGEGLRPGRRPDDVMTL
jgi:hypothetical protein